MRVLYFTVVSLVAPTNGGSICCRNHVERLVADPDIELFAMTAGPLGDKEGTEAFFKGLDVPHHFQPFRQGNVHHAENRIRSIAGFAFKATFQFPWEMQALNQPHIEEGIAWAIRGYSIDVLIIDYHASSLFLTLPRSDVRTALISLNREGDFYADQIRLGQTHHGTLTARASLSRLRRWERGTDAAVDQLIVIGPTDLPKHRTRRVPVCITPFLDPKSERWNYSASNSVFFVGAIAHYPNRLAIEWLTRELAPRLAGVAPTAKITIVGATDADIAFPHRNVELLGWGDADAVSRLFRASDLMICPVENDYGVKFKALEALAYGTPLLASKQTLSTLLHLQGPSIDLHDPAAAARLVADLLASRATIEALAREQQEQQTAFIGSQAGVWSRTLRGLLDA